MFFNWTSNRYYTNGTLYGYYSPYGSTTPTNQLYVTNSSATINLANAYGTLPVSSQPANMFANLAIGFAPTNATPTSNNFVSAFGPIAALTKTNHLLWNYNGELTDYWTTNGSTINSKNIAP